MISNYSISLGVNCVQEESTLVHFQVVHCSQYSGIIAHLTSPGTYRARSRGLDKDRSLRKEKVGSALPCS